MSGKLSSRYRKRNTRADVGLSLAENHISSSVQMPVHESQSQSCILESQASFRANVEEDKENKSTANENVAAPQLKSDRKSKLSSKNRRRKVQSIQDSNAKASKIKSESPVNACPSESSDQLKKRSGVLQSHKISESTKLQSIQDPNARVNKVKWASPIKPTDTRLSDSSDQLTKRSGILKPQNASESSNINNTAAAADSTTQDSYEVRFGSFKDKKRAIVESQKFIFTKGHTLQSKSPEYEGFAFTIGEKVDKKYVSYTDVWMKADKTYLGSMLTNLGYEWVRLKKHKMIPINGMIELEYLYNCVHLQEMDPEGALCYEEYEEKSATSLFAFEFGLGEPLNTNEQTLKKPPKVLDLFAGGGGMSVGMRNVGFNVKYKVRLLDLPATICNSLFMPLF
jgi:hypothetical protein